MLEQGIFIVRVLQLSRDEDRLVCLAHDITLNQNVRSLSPTRLGRGVPVRHAVFMEHEAPLRQRQLRL